MKKYFKLIAIFALMVLGIFICQFTPKERPIQIRMKNNTGQYVDHYWLGSKGQRGFGDLEIDELTRYRGVGLHPSEYWASSATMNGQSYASILLPNRMLELESGDLNIVYLLDLDNSGEVEQLDQLGPGKYTFTLSLDENGEPILSVFQDE